MTLAMQLSVSGMQGLEIICVQRWIFRSDNCIHYKFSIIDTLVPLAQALGFLVMQMSKPLIGSLTPMLASHWLGWDAAPGQLRASAPV